MNEQHWKDFYKGFKEQEPSSFALFVLDKLEDGTLIDLGCGNGRDTNFFKENGIDAIGYDAINGDMAENIIAECDNLYMRFFLHSITEDVEDAIFSQIKFKKCFIEARTTKDAPDNDHWRRLIDVEELLYKLIGQGFKIEYVCTGRGMSEYKGEDPYLVRIICQSQF